MSQESKEKLLRRLFLQQLKIYALVPQDPVHLDLFVKLLDEFVAGQSEAQPSTEAPNPPQLEMGHGTAPEGVYIEPKGIFALPFFGTSLHFSDDLGSGSGVAEISAPAEAGAPPIEELNAPIEAESELPEAPAAEESHDSN